VYVTVSPMVACAAEFPVSTTLLVTVRVIDPDAVDSQRVCLRLNQLPSVASDESMFACGT
jgi:hypothetical protein